jgi:hypothetical protein
VFRQNVIRDGPGAAVMNSGSVDCLFEGVKHGCARLQFLPQDSLSLSLSRACALSMGIDISNVCRQHCDDDHVRTRRPWCVLPWQCRRRLRVRLDTARKHHQRQHLPALRCVSRTGNALPGTSTSTFFKLVNVEPGFMEKRPQMRETLTNNAVYMDDVMGGYTIESNTFIDVVCHTLSYQQCACLPTHFLFWCACLHALVFCLSGRCWDYCCANWAG